MAREEIDIYAALVDAIDRGELRAGSRLVELDLAERYGVSRTPVREALNRLESQGIAARDGRRGLAVAVLDYDQLGELYELREVLEGFAARQAARHASDAEIAILREMVDEDGQIADDPRALALSNKRFHRQLHRTSHNRYLNDMLQMMRRSLALLSGTTLAVTGRGQQSIEEHAAIVAAIADRNEANAETAARTHIHNAYTARLKLEAAETPPTDLGDST